MFPASLTEKEFPVTLNSLLVTKPFGPWVLENLWETCQLAMSELVAGELQVVLESLGRMYLSGDGCLAENACRPMQSVPWISWKPETAVLPRLD